MRNPSRGVALGVVALALLVAACGGSKDRPTPTGSPTPTSPSPSPAPTEPPAAPPAPPGCTYAVSADPDDFEREGGNGKLIVATAAGCQWTIKTDASWAVVEGPTQGEGPATLKFSAEPNDGVQPRQMTVTIAGQSISITQPGQGDCTYEVSPVTAAIPRVAWAGDLIVSTARGCRWTAASDASWIHLSTAGGSGSGRITYQADFNPQTAYAAQRLGVIAIRWAAPTAGQNVRISQWGNCNVALGAPPEGAPGFSGYPGYPDATVNVGAAGGKIHLFVLTDPFMGCAWTVESSDAWVAVDFPPLHRVNGGDGDLHLTVPANPSASSRRALLTVGERPLTIIQEGRR